MSVIIRYLLLLIGGGKLPAMAKRMWTGECLCMLDVEHGVNVASSYEHS